MNKIVSAPMGKFENDTHYFPLRIYYTDTDAGGVVYYANYLAFAEKARTEFIRLLDWEQRESLEENKIAFMVKNCNVEYMAPAKMDDELIIKTKVKNYKGVSLTMEQEVTRDNKVLVKLETKLVCVSLTKLKPCKMPNLLTEKLQSFSNIEK